MQFDIDLAKHIGLSEEEITALSVLIRKYNSFSLRPCMYVNEDMVEEVNHSLQYAIQMLYELPLEKKYHKIVLPN